MRTGSHRAGLVLLSHWRDGSCWSVWCWQGAEPLPAGEERLLPWPVGADLQDPPAGVTVAYRLNTLGRDWAHRPFWP